MPSQIDTTDTNLFPRTFARLSGDLTASIISCVSSNAC